MTKSLDWENLKELKCPKCYKDLEKRFNNYICVCGFNIGIPRLLELAEEMIDNEYEKEQFNELITAD